MTALFLGFVVISLSALWRTYRALNGTTAELQVHWGTDSEFKRAILGRLTQPRWKVAICLHAVVDVIIIYFVWAIR